MPDFLSTEASPPESGDDNRRFLIGLARAFGGAIIFALPLMMTMEMWQLGFYVNPFRLTLFLILIIPVLTALSYYAGFEPTFSLRRDAVDAFVAIAVGFVAGTVCLLLLNIIHFDMTLDEFIGKVSLQAIPGSIGAMLAQDQFGVKDENDKKKDAGFAGHLFLMGAGALFLAFNVAPTEEMILLAYIMTEWHAIALALASLVIMHAFVYSIEFRGQASVSENASFWSIFFRFTVNGYALALLISLYVLWTFGRADHATLESIVQMTVVLGFPAAIGAAAARLVL
ncbi:MAG TPA: TIGR02587 family membrane protein [Casimicrobiaceae bacterium]|nr:TIGR02587 family membrane protein [Casimicrobiaceae bacterium]